MGWEMGDMFRPLQLEAEKDDPTVYCTKAKKTHYKQVICTAYLYRKNAHRLFIGYG